LARRFIPCLPGGGEAVAFAVAKKQESGEDMSAAYRADHRGKLFNALREGTMTLFPEGTRSRTGEVRRGRPGAGLMILGTEPTVIPVAIDGMQDLLPIGAKFPRPFKRITIYYGKPFDYSAYLGRPRSKETAQELVDEVIEVIRRQLDEIRSGSD
jgi:1-acyl-sn-glycerol-3-phosphate acyltransferase